MIARSMYHVVSGKPSAEGRAHYRRSLMRVYKMSQLFIRPALLLAVLLFNALAISAQSNNQSELIRLVNGLQAKYDNVSSLAADFTQVYNEPGKQERRESGRVLLKKPGRMRWDYTSPEEKLFICDGKW